MVESVASRAPDRPLFGGSFMSSEKTSPLSFEPSSSPRVPPRPLGELVRTLDPAEVRGDPGVLVRDVAYRSGEAGPGSLFFCVPGERLDGHDFAGDAERLGAVAAVVERWLPLRCVQVRVPSVRQAMGPVASAFFGHPSRRLTVVGVTGTNGKTTTTYLMESIFAAAGQPAAVIGTTGARIAGRPLSFERTTPEAPDLQRLLSVMVHEGVAGVAMEVSSHGLDQHRVDGTRYRCAVFTNLTQDHLDYHGTLEAYFEAKARLFSPAFTERAAINADSSHGRALAGRLSIPALTFAIDAEADLLASGVRITSRGLSFRADGLQVTSALRGRFNVSNCLGAVAAARQVEIGDEAIARGIAALRGVPGRMEPVEASQPFAVLVDYAHTPDSLENLLTTARSLAEGRLIVVFGCGGDRDRGKRPLMGEAATRLADFTVLTSDNPRSEDPLGIIAEIESGAKRGGGDYAVEPDRRRAIRSALALAATGDVVVIAGKGHETGQQFADRTVPFDDRVVAAEEAAALAGSSR